MANAKECSDVTYGQAFTFNKSPFATCRCTISGCASREEAAEGLAKMLRNVGYTKPASLSEWWRWPMFERRLPADVAKHFDQLFIHGSVGS